MYDNDLNKTNDSIIGVLKMGKRIDFLRKCYNEDIHEFERDHYKILGKTFLLTGMFVLVICLFSIYILASYLILRNILTIFLKNNQELFEQWIYIVYGLVLGMAFSVIFQSIPSTDKSIKYVFRSLRRTFVYFACFILAIFICHIVILIIHLLGFF